MSAIPPPHPDRLAAMLAAMWERSQPQIRVRLDLLDAATTALAAGTLSPEFRAEAHATAHKLAGILGTFGFPEGTRLARQLEQTLQAGSPDPALLAEQVTALQMLLFPEQPW